MSNSFQDPGLICNPSATIYAADAKLSPEQAILLGRVVGVDVQVTSFAGFKLFSIYNIYLLDWKDPNCERKIFFGCAF